MQTFQLTGRGITLLTNGPAELLIDDTAASSVQPKYPGSISEMFEIIEFNPLDTLR